MNCKVCGRPEGEKPSIFRNEPFCSDNCRKVMVGEEMPNWTQWANMDLELLDPLLALWSGVQVDKETHNLLLKRAGDLISKRPWKVGEDG